MRRTLFVVNPTGHGGAGPQVWQALQAELAEHITPENVRFTERAGHAIEIAATATGYDTIAAVGGDGTVGEVLSGIMEQGEPRPRLAIIPGGTGNDVARQLGAFPVDKAMSALREDRTCAFDVMRVDSQVEGRPAHRYGFLTGTVGFSIVPMQRPWLKRLFPTTIGFLAATVAAMVAYRPRHMTVRWDGREHSGRLWMVIVGNAERVLGGSMCLAPGARMDDGELNVSIIPARSKLAMFTKVLAKVGKGEHVLDPAISYFPVKRIEIESDPPSLVDVDGDLFGMTPATFTLFHKAVEVVCETDEADGDR